MYNDILNIIYDYVINSRLPDINFIDSILNIVIDNENLEDYITDIYYDYHGSSLASYFYEPRILKFNIGEMLKQHHNYYHFYSRIYNVNSNYFDRYFFMCLSVLEVIFHEIEHVIQNRKVNTLARDNFEKQLIEVNNIAIEVYPKIYKKQHDLFPIEREANIKSCDKVRELISLYQEYSKFIMSIFNNKYNRFINEYYSKNSYPLLEFLYLTKIKISYNNVLVTKNNTNKLLMKTNKDISLEERLIKGLPLYKNEYHLIKNRNYGVKK